MDGRIRALGKSIQEKSMSRTMSFEDANGRIRYADGSMFIPVCSKEIYEYVMNCDKVFH